MMYPIAEIFDSVQGEGINTGRYCTFIRLRGCNLNCPWCDSKDTWNTVPYDTYWSIPEILSKVNQHLVVITGGEPTIHNLEPLLRELYVTGHEIAIETNGTNDLSGCAVSMLACVTCSPKPPLYRTCLYYDELKIVISNELKDSVMERIIYLNERIQHFAPIYLQPEFNEFDKSVKKALEYVKKYPTQLRMGLQAHKVWKVE